MASGDLYLLFILILYALIVVRVPYVLVHVYRERTRNVRKLR